MTFASSIFHNIKWSGMSQYGRQALQLLTTIILARLLQPSDFGLISMAMVVIVFLNLIKDLGISSAIIQKIDLSENSLSSIYWFNIVFGIVLMVCLFGFAPHISIFYNEVRLVPILRILSFSFLISSIGTVFQAIFERNLNFHHLAKIELGGALGGALLGINFAWNGWGVWSLVFQHLVTAFITTILLYYFSSWRPRFIFHWDDIRAVSHYGLNFTGFQIFNYFSRNFDYLLIGKYLGAQNLGYYTLAYQIVFLPIQNITGVINRVMFPVYSQFQNDNRAFREVYLKVTTTVALITFPLILSLMIISKPLILTLLGEKWTPSILILIILAPIGMLQTIGSTVGSIYLTKGRTDWMFKWGMASSILIVISFLIGVRWGIIGVASAYAVASLSLLYPNFAIPFRLIELKIVHLLKAIQPIAYSSLIMFLLTLSIKYILPENIPSIGNILILILTALSSFTWLIWKFSPLYIKEVIALIKEKNG